MWKEKLGNYLIDVSKYVLTAVIITSLFEDLEDSKLLVYGFGISTSLIILIVGLVLTKKKEDKKWQPISH